MNSLKTPVALLATLLMLVALPSVAAAASSQVSRESVQTFEQQLKDGEITAVKFNHADRRMFVTLKDGKVYFVHYQAHGAPPLESRLKAKGVTVTVLARDEAQQEAEQVKNERTSNVKTFVIIGVIVIVLLAIGVYFATRRRGERE